MRNWSSSFSVSRRASDDPNSGHSEQRSQASPANPAPSGYPRRGTSQTTTLKTQRLVALFGKQGAKQSAGPWENRFTAFKCKYQYFPSGNLIPISSGSQARVPSYRFIKSI